MDKQKVRFTVCGSDFCIVTNDSEEYIRSLAAGTEEKIMKYVSESAGVSVVQAAILTAMELLIVMTYMLWDTHRHIRFIIILFLWALLSRILSLT